MTAKVEPHPENDAITNVGSNYRIEPGPPRITSVATEELLHNDNTAGHYHPPIVDGESVTFAKDADGKPIKLGEEFTYLDWGGDNYEGKRIFYVYEKQPVNSVDEFTKDGEPNPFFVPAHVREAAEQGEHGDNRVFYDYRWVEVATRSSLEAAIDFAQRNAVD
jgi:hypothetical protein